MRYKSLLLVISMSAVVLLSGCGGSSDGERTIGTGVYVDAVVEGVEYICGAEEGISDANGVFSYEVGHECIFKLGSITLRRVSGSKLQQDGVILQETNTKVAQLLLTIDENPQKEKISINKILKKEFESLQKQNLIDSNPQDILDAAVESLRDKGISTESVTVITADLAKKHLQESYQEYCADDGFVLVESADFLGECVKERDADIVAPVIILNGASTITIDVNTTFSDPGATATDDRDGSVTVNVSGSVNSSKEGTYTLTYTAEDSAQNRAEVTRTVNVVHPGSSDTIVPEIKLLGDNPLYMVKGDNYKEPGYNAYDDRDGEITSLVTVSDNIDIDTVGSYSVTYSVKDKAGNSTTVTRTVKVELAADTTPPVITLKGDSYMTIAIGDTFIDPGATATDDRDGSVAVKVSGSVDSSTEGTYKLTYTAQDSAGNSATATRTVSVKDNSAADPENYIPKDANLTDAIAVKFLNMATFGATPELIAELKQKGVIKWVDEQLAMQYDTKNESLLRRLIYRAININPAGYGVTPQDTNATIPESEVDKFLENNDYCFNQNQRNGVNELDLHYGLILDTQVRFKDQIRQRTAYALSQIIIASQSNDSFFSDRGETLSYYYDLLLKHAFGNYSDLLYDVSLSPTMATFLTYANNEKEYVDPDTNTTILPDENYGREIMQLFSIGLYELNMNGTEQRVNDQRVPTYEQTDVNEMSKIFTGLQYAKARWNDLLLKGDSTHSLECNMQYHDTTEKHVLGETLPSGQTCEQDVRSAVDLVMSHSNVAPFIAKKLILRLTKSNPTTAYVQRVAEVFADTKGDLKETIRAVLLDEEIWENIKEDKGVKFKEPYMLFTEMIRAFDFKPIPWRTHTYNDRTWIEQEPGFLSRSLYNYFGQYPTQSPSVFNFYDDTFEPDNYEFKIRGFVGPELSLYTSSYAVAMNNFLVGILEGCSIQKQMRAGEDEEKMPDQSPDSYSGTLTYTYMYVDFNEALDVMRNNGFGESLEENRGGDEETKAREQVATALVDYIANKLIGKPFKQDKRQKFIDLYKDRPRSYHSDNNNETQFRIMDFWIMPLIVDMVRSDEFMVQ